MSSRDGFHAGVVGVAWAAVNVARLLGVEEVHARASAVAMEVMPPSAPGRCPDLVMGAAGSVLGLLALADDFADQCLMENATATGDTLIGSATVSSHGWSWAVPGKRHPAHLCGVSHGAAGIGWALLELFSATGEERFRDAATGAFAYERSWMDPDSGRWPDLRIGGQRRGRLAAINSGITGTWCYGEAGIALTRLRANAVLGTGPHSSDATVALETTRRHLADAVPDAIDDLSLCHGAAGAGEALLCAAAALDGHWHQAADEVAHLGRLAVDRHAETGRAWPCGAPGGTPPGLFRGLSGIGWLFLRLHDPTMPSPLAPIGTLDTGPRST